VCAGFSVIYSVTRVLHLAQGGVVILAGYLFYTGINFWHWPILPSVLFSLVLTTGIGIGINHFIYERLRHKAVLSMAGALVATFSLLLILNYSLLAIYGSATRSFSDLQGTIHQFGSVLLSTNEIRIFIFCPLLLFLFFFFLKWTRTGKAIRAVAENQEVAEVVGISSKQARAIIFLIGSFLAACVGILYGIEYNLEPEMSVLVAVNIFNRAILGGIGSVGGALTGSLLIQSVVELTTWYWNVAWEAVMSFGVLFLVLIFRPNGLLRKSKRSL
jgi:branched-chain amino acid transport system permease protein